MPDPVDRDRLRTSVHEVCREANKGIFNNLESVLLRLVDAQEAGECKSPEHECQSARCAADHDEPIFKKRDTTGSHFVETARAPTDCDKCHHRAPHPEDGCQHVYGGWRCNCRALSTVATERRERDG